MTLHCVGSLEGRTGRGSTRVATVWLRVLLTPHYLLRSAPLSLSELPCPGRGREDVCQGLMCLPEPLVVALGRFGTHCHEFHPLLRHRQPRPPFATGSPSRQHLLGECCVRNVSPLPHRTRCPVPCISHPPSVCTEDLRLQWRNRVPPQNPECDLPTPSTTDPQSRPL